MHSIATIATLAGLLGPQVVDEYGLGDAYTLVGLGTAIAVSEPDPPVTMPMADVDLGDSFLFHARLGNRLLPNLASEVLAEYYDGLDAEVGTDDTEVDLWSLAVDIKLYPWVGTVEPYGQVGFGWLWADFQDPVGEGLRGSQSDGVLRSGGGLDFRLTEKIFLNLDARYVLPLGDLEDLAYFTVTAGVGFYF